jgi:3-oxoadipate enol-lactonase
VPYAEAKNASIYYEVGGDGPAVTLLHGAGGSGAIWFQQVTALRARHRVVVMDHRGFGLSRCAPDDLLVQHFADDLRAVLDAAQIDETALVCQSMGGWTGLRFAISHRDRVSAIVLSATPGGVQSPAVAASFAAASEAAKHARSPSDLVLSPTFRREQEALTYLYERIGQFNQPTEGVLAQLAQSSTGVDPAELDGFDIPILFIAGAVDPIFPSTALSELADQIPGASLATLESGHSPFYECPDAFNALIMRFLVENGA